MKVFTFRFYFAALSVLAFGTSLPTLNIENFAWAENLAFDGMGGLFVSESVRGELWKISLDASGLNYTSKIHVSKGFKQFGGLATVADGSKIYAAAVFEDKTNGIISLSTNDPLVSGGEQSYSVIIHNMAELANGMALVESDNALYGTAEKGTLSRIDISTGKETIISSTLDKPDGLWYDIPSSKLIIGLLVSKKIMIYDVKSGVFSDSFAAASSLGVTHMLDDLTMVNGVDSSDLGKTVIVVADWLGKQFLQLSLDGTLLKTVPLPEGISSLYEPTSIRRGRGPGFDANSFYITEGGGLTKRVNNRRVLQLTPGII